MSRTAAKKLSEALQRLKNAKTPEELEEAKTNLFAVTTQHKLKLQRSANKQRRLTGERMERARFAISSMGLPGIPAFPLSNRKRGHK